MADVCDWNCVLQRWICLYLGHSAPSGSQLVCIILLIVRRLCGSVLCVCGVNAGGLVQSALVLRQETGVTKRHLYEHRERHLS